VSDVKINILIIEDDEAARISLKAILSLEGYSVREAENAVQALALLKEKQFDVLLVDYRLPDMNGIELIKQALAVSRDAIPIMITGAVSLENAVEAMRIGAHDYLVKPVNMEELKKILLNVIIERDEFRKGKERFHQVVVELEHPDSDALIPIVKPFANAGKKRGSLLGKLHLFNAVKRFFWGI
jgi:two-component system NtrC family response regulator/two-component system response regulator HydG